MRIFDNSNKNELFPGAYSDADKFLAQGNVQIEPFAILLWDKEEYCSRWQRIDFYVLVIFRSSVPAQEEKREFSLYLLHIN